MTRAASTTGPAAAVTRERILSAAGELIAEGGFAATSVAAVGRRAGVVASALYYHFASKTELLLEVFRGTAERQLADMQGAAGGAEGFDERFAAVIRTYATSALRSRRLAWALVYEPTDPVLNAERLAYRRRYRDGVAALLRDGMAAGVIPPQDEGLLAAAIVGAIAEVLIGPLSPLERSDLTETEIVDQIVELCRRAIGAEVRRPA